MATDSALVLEAAYDYFGDKVFSYSAISNINNQPLHIDADPAPVFLKYQDAICDLLMLGLASNLYISNVKPGKNKNYSGFSLLGLLLNRNQSIIHNLMSVS